jgi:hypothetical protein
VPGAGQSSQTCPMKLRLPGGRLGSLVRPCHLDRYALSARPEVACRYRTGRVALRETARLKIVPQVREEGKGVPARQPVSRGALAVCGPSPLPCCAECRRRRHRGFARLRHAKYAAAWALPVRGSSLRHRSDCGMHPPWQRHDGDITTGLAVGTVGALFQKTPRPRTTLVVNLDMSLMYGTPCP